jgi:hypothetical protein
MVPTAGSPETWCAISLVGLAFAGYLKMTPFLSWLPVDLTALSAFCCILSWLAYANRTGHAFLKSMQASVVMWVAFLPGVVIGVLSGLDETKTIYLFTTTLLCVLLPSIVATSVYAQRAWLGGMGIIGVGVGLGAVFFTDAQYLISRGRLDIEGGSAGREVGSLVVLLAAVAMLSSVRRAWRVLCLAIAMAGLVLMIIIGARGPFLSTMISIPLAFATAMLPSRTRVKGLLSLALVSISLVCYLVLTGSPLLSKIWIVIDTTDPARTNLYGIAHSQMYNSLTGLGWSGFSRLGNFEYPHNIFLEIFVEGGWVAGLVFVGYAAVALTRLRRTSSTPYGMAFYSLAIYWLAVAQTSNNINGNRVTWAALAFGFAGVATTVKGKAAMHSSTISTRLE